MASRIIIGSVQARSVFYPIRAQQDGVQFLAMDFIEGRGLDEVLAEARGAGVE